MKLFGYDRGSQDKYVDAQKLARDNAYVDSRRIEEAAGILRGQIPGITRSAQHMFSAGEQGAAIGRANAASILAETGEWARRREGAQGAEQSLNRASAAASGIRLDTGGSSDIFQGAVKEEHAKEIAWGWKAGRSQADIATREGERVKAEASSAAEGILSGIPAVQSQAALYETDASALRSSADLAVAEARANRASARSGAVLSGITTIIAAIATYGAATGWAAGASTAARVGAGALAVGALGSIFLANRGSSAGDIAAAGMPQTSTPVIPGITAGKGLDVSQMPEAKAFTPPTLPGSEKATATGKRQYAALESKKGKAKTDTNIFGGSANPLMAVGA